MSYTYSIQSMSDNHDLMFKVSDDQHQQVADWGTWMIYTKSFDSLHDLHEFMRDCGYKVVLSNSVPTCDQSDEIDGTMRVIDTSHAVFPLEDIKYL